MDIIFEEGKLLQKFSRTMHFTLGLPAQVAVHFFHVLFHTLVAHFAAGPFAFFAEIRSAKGAYGESERLVGQVPWAAAQSVARATTKKVNFAVVLFQEFIHNSVPGGRVNILH